MIAGTRVRQQQCCQSPKKWLVLALIGFEARGTPGYMICQGYRRHRLGAWRLKKASQTYFCDKSC